MSEPPQSRLDRELEEILASKAKEPIRLSERRAAKTRAARRVRLDGIVSRGRTWVHRLFSMPLAVAFVSTFLALLIVDCSRLLALLLCAAAVLAIWLPGVLGLTGARTSSGNVKYWRGQAYTSTRDAVSRSPVDSIKRYFDQRR